jgi:hypothetical protein
MIPCVDLGVITLNTLSELSQADLKKMCSTCNAINGCDLSISVLGGAATFKKSQSDSPRTVTKLGMPRRAHDFNHFRALNRLHKTTGHKSNRNIYQIHRESNGDFALFRRLLKER